MVPQFFKYNLRGRIMGDGTPISQVQSLGDGTYIVQVLSPRDGTSISGDV